MSHFLLGLIIGLCLAIPLTIYLKKESQKSFLEKLKEKDEHIKHLRYIIKEKSNEIDCFKSELKSDILASKSDVKNIQKQDQDKIIITPIHDLDIVKGKKNNILKFSPSQNLSPKYLQLQEYLINRKWQDADRQTSDILFEISQVNQPYLDINHYQSLPLQDLAIIDEIWSYYSDGLFGFSAQYHLFVKLCSQHK